MLNYLIRCYVILILVVFACHLADNENYPSQRYHLSEWPSRKLNPSIPLNSTGDILWANGLWNWGFTNNVQVIHYTNFNALPIKIESNGVPVNVKGGLYYPAYNLLEGETDSAKSNIACNPFQSGFPNPIAAYSAPEASIWGPINGNNSPANAWTNRGSPIPVNWYGVDLGEKKFISGVMLEFLDNQYHRKCRLPENYFLEYEKDQEWQRIPDQQIYPEKASSGLNLITFPGINLQKIRVVFSPQTDGYSGLFRFQLQGEGALLPQVTEKKMVTRDDVLISLLEIMNPSWHFPISVKIKAGTAWATQIEKNSRIGKKTFFDQELSLLACSPQLNDGELSELEGQFQLQPREKRNVRLAMAMAKDEKIARARVKNWLKKFRPLKSQQAEYETWFRDNIPFFQCSDNWLTHLYYLRWQNLKRNYYAPESGFLKFPSFTAIRGDYPYFTGTYLSGFSNLLQELRWLKAAKWGESAFRNFIDNMNPNNQLPSVIYSNSIEYTDKPSESLFKALYQFYLVQSNIDFLTAQLPRMKKHIESSRLNLETEILASLVREMVEKSQVLKPNELSTTGLDTTFSKIQNLFPPIAAYYQNCYTIASISGLIDDSSKMNVYAELTRQVKNLIQTDFLNPIFQSSSENFSPSNAWIFPWYQISECLPDSIQHKLWRKFFNRLEKSESVNIHESSADSSTNITGIEKITSDITRLNTFQFSNYLSFLIDRLHEKSAGEIEKDYFWKLLIQYATKQNQQFDSINIRINSEVLPEISFQTPKNVETFAHTKFTDFLITGLIGLVPDDDRTKIVFHPLAPTNALDYFMMEKIPYHGHEINVVWDKPGGVDYLNDLLDGFQVYVDRKLQANIRTLQRIEVFLDE
ncbi:hypothetical protein JW964_07015 [candidate division KSB1 bacterium]|nr:hypothetical protein [candidate division KSB1 bacterium]